MNEADAKDQFAKMSPKQQVNVLNLQKKNGLTFEQAVAEYAEKPMPSGHPDEAIAPNTVRGKTRDRKLGRR
jgi:hypothetical protein